jgi:formylglycine-generating enzyme required for sulfatase activity
MLDVGQGLQQGRYRIKERLSQGGMGTVYLATDRNLGDWVVAIKENSDNSPETQQQFQREAAVLARLTHSNLPRVTDYFIEPSGQQYLVMDYVPGDDLREIIRQRGEPFAEAEALALIEPVMDALAYMHGWVNTETGQPSPIVHRDIKPANIKRTPNGRTVLVDFGLAKYQTGEGTLIGARAVTPGYSPLEQYAGGTDTRSDIYALGATLYFLLTGEKPPDAPAIAGRTPLLPPHRLNPQISRATERVILRAMQMHAVDRYQNIQEMHTALFGTATFTSTRQRRLPFIHRSPRTAPAPPPVRQRRTNLALWIIVALIGLTALAGVALAASSRLWERLNSIANLIPSATATVAVAMGPGAPPDEPALADLAGEQNDPPLSNGAIVTTTTVTNGLALSTTETTTAITVAPTTALSQVLTTTENAETPTPTPSPTVAESASSTPTTTPTDAPTLTATATAPPTPTATATPPPTATDTATASPTPSATASPTALETATPTPLPTATATSTATSSPTATATTVPVASNIVTGGQTASAGEPAATARLTSTLTATATNTLPPTATPSPTESATPTPSPSATPTPLPTATTTPTATASPTPSATDTPEPTETATIPPTATATPSPTNPPTATAATPPTATVAPSPTSTITLAPTPTDMPTATATPTTSPSPSATASPRPTDTATTPPTATATALPTATITLAPTVTAMLTATATPIENPSPSATASPRPTDTPTATPTPRPSATPTRTAPTATATPNTPVAGEIRVNAVDGARYVYIPAGEFRMGSDSGARDEKPSHIVLLDDFWIMQTETTYAQYAACVRAGVCTPPDDPRWDDPRYADHPVVNIEWEEANDYAIWAGGRLPTEAEWEKAARGVDGRTYPWGEETPVPALLNFNYTYGDTHPVGSYPEGTSPFGVLDMAGNVEEWVADWYDNDYYANSPERNPPGPEIGVLRVLRGGSYKSNRADVRTTVRGRTLPTAHYPNVGFRIVISNP